MVNGDFLLHCDRRNVRFQVGPKRAESTQPGRSPISYSHRIKTNREEQVVGARMRLRLISRSFPRAMGRSGIILGLVIGSIVSLEGVAQEIDDAAALLRAAAEQGDASAQYNLGLMYLEGQGVKQDNVEAYAWIRTAAAQGRSGTLEIRQALLREMTTSQEDRAIELAREYREKYVTR